MTYRQNLAFAAVAGVLAVIALAVVVMWGVAPSPATPPQPTPYPSNWSPR